MNKLKELLNKKNFYFIVCLLIALHPLIELDYLLADYITLPRITTIIDFIILPLLAILAFILFEKNKKRVGIFSVIYALLFGVYFILHIISANDLQYRIHLPNNYVFLISDEIFYTITLFLPLVYIYVIYLGNLKEIILKRISICLSCIIALPIFISNLFVFGKSTYLGYTIDNFLSWFSLPFDILDHHPRMYATKFFFEEGNTIGVLMILILPLLYYFFYKSNNKKEKGLLGSLIIIQSLAMIMLSTRIATYGTVLIPLAMFGIYLLLIILKYEKFKITYSAFLIILVLINGFIIPYGPAYQNQLLDALDFGFQKENDAEKHGKKDEVRRGGENLVEWSEEWRDYYVYIFEDNAFMIGVTPPVYYKEWYDYKYDPEFWVNFIFDYELEERINGRQIETIFTNYKWAELNNYEKALGLGYGTFMRGSILLERDFAQQYYSYGSIGFSFIMAPWLILFITAGLKLLLAFKKRGWTYLNIILMMIITIGLASSYISGHILDELSSSLFISLCFGILFNNLKGAKDE